MRHLRSGYILFVQILFLQAVQAQPDFTANEATGCTPFLVRFTLDLSTVDEDTIDYLTWNFGIGDTLNASPADTVEFEYLNEGVYTVAVAINGNRSDTIIKQDYITVHQTIRSVFRYEEYAPNHNFRFIPLDEITDTFATYFYNWRYNKLTGTDQRVNDYVITIENQEMAIDSITLDTGIYQVTLWIDDIYGCFSRSEQIVQVYDDIEIPNVFVAGSGEFFIIDPKNLNIILRFQLYNRYGMLVYEQEAPVINWDGRTNSGKDLNIGVYYYVLEAVEGDSTDRYTQNGFIHLYRSN
ncbi:hypothetical protein ES705_09125 [subsurface metagenome]